MFGKIDEKMEDKMIGFMRNNVVWRLVDLSRIRKIIGAKWVVKIKLKVDGTVKRYKARLVANGYK